MHIKNKDIPRKYIFRVKRISNIGCIYDDENYFMLKYYWLTWKFLMDMQYFLLKNRLGKDQFYQQVKVIYLQQRKRLQIDWYFYNQEYRYNINWFYRFILSISIYHYWYTYQKSKFIILMVYQKFTILPPCLSEHTTECNNWNDLCA